jgi:hypothetical protein
VDTSLKFSGLSLSTLKTVRLPIPNKDDVESHLVMTCAAGKMLHKTGLRMLQIKCTGMKTPILGVSVFKVLKDSPENFRDVSTLADCDTDKSIDAASKLVDCTTKKEN